MSFHKRVQQITYKITKSDTTKIVKIIGNNHLILEEKLEKISPLINVTHSSDKSFIASRIAKYINTYQFSSVCDFGGGNGEFLEALGKSLKTKEFEKVCIESNTEWYEPYQFNKEGIKYILWNSKNELELNYDIVFAISVLHHLDTQEKNIFFSSMPKGTLLIIKEHDVRNSIDADVINWEHHLYHLSKSSDIASYLKAYKTNFISKSKLIEELKMYDFDIVDEFGRLFDKSIDTKNPSCLYWLVVRKN